MTLDAKTRLSLRQAIDQFSEATVRQSDKTLSNAQMEALKQRKTQLRLGQLNNLLGVARETDSPAVVVNWIRYQMGRRETRDGWRNSGLGDKVIKDIRDMETSARQVSQDVFGDDSPNHLRQAHIALIRRYVGYLKRWFVAKGGQQ